MARIKKFLSTEEIVKSNVDTYLVDTTETYPHFLEVAPTFISYYSMSAYKSTHDVSFEAYNEVVGDESPNRFHKIENLPVYELETADFSTQQTDMGWESEVTSSFVVLPGTIVPVPDDLLEIIIHTKKYLFMVTNVVPDNFGNKKFYKVTFRLTDYTIKEAERRVDETFRVDFDTLGSQGSSIIRKDYHEFLSVIRERYDTLLSNYVHRYYDRAGRCFTESSKYLDLNLNFFLAKENLLVPYKKFRNSIYVSPTVLKLTNRSDYSHTFFTHLSKFNFDKLVDAPDKTVLELNDTTIKYSFDFFMQNKLDRLLHVHSPNNDVVKEVFNFDVFLADDLLVPSTDDYTIFLRKFVEFSRSPNGEQISILEECLSHVELLDERFEDNPEEPNSVSQSDYYNLPLVLFILRQLVDHITDK